MSRPAQYISCQFEGCTKSHKAKGYCYLHYQRLIKYGDPSITKIRPVGSRKPMSNGYIMVFDKYEHILIAEKALGRKLPKGAQVHHVDSDQSNNSSTNLVICPNQKYHALIEQRTKALEICGHADWLKCTHCQQYDNPENMFVAKSSAPMHRECRRMYENKQYHAKNDAEALEACGNSNYRQCNYCGKWGDSEKMHHGHHPECFSETLTKSWTLERKLKSRTVKVTIESKEYSVTDLAEKFNLRIDVISERAKKGLPFTEVTSSEKRKSYNPVALSKGAVISAAKRNSKTHCNKGHEYTEENTYIQKSGKYSWRCCRRCHADRQLARNNK